MTSGSETGKPLLAVDLDGTLIRSDMLYECFWAGFSRDWKTPFRGAAALMRGRAALKAEMRRSGAPDPAFLPYRPEVLAEIEAWRAAGGRVALVTAADQELADSVAAHLGCFDAVHGSDGVRNLKGEAKASFLADTYGQFAYMGDHAADLSVWRAAAEVITVGASASVRAQAEKLGKPTRHIAAATSEFRPLLRAMRPHQWAKNLLIFLPLVAAHAFSVHSLLMGVLAFVAFSLVASSVYLLNDLLDIAADRVHPRKRMRPLASGALSLRTGMLMVPVLLVAGALICLFLPPLFAPVLLGYYAVTVSYSLWLKRKSLIDICILAVLYTFRVAAGAVATGFAMSDWLLAFSAFLFLSLAAVKRQAELIDLQARGSDTVAGRGYSVGDLNVVTQMATAAGFMSILVLMLYINDPIVRAQYAHPQLLWGACIILLYWVSRMVLVTQRGFMNDDPVVFALRDRVSQVVFVIIIALFTGATVL